MASRPHCPKLPDDRFEELLPDLRRLHEVGFVSLLLHLRRLPERFKGDQSLFL